MCFIGDLEPAEVWSESHPRARKPHRCASCGVMIAIGEKYLRHFSLQDREPVNECMCLACESARDAFGEAHEGVMACPSYFPAMLEECVGEDEESAEKWAPMLSALQARGGATVGGA